MGFGSALATDRSTTVMMGRWSTCTGLREGYEIIRLRALWVIQALSGHVQLWAAISYVGVPGGSTRCSCGGCSKGAEHHLQRVEVVVVCCFPEGWCLLKSPSQSI